MTTEERERRLYADTHYERCHGINCPCYNEGWRKGRAEGAIADGTIRSRSKRASPSAH